MKRYSIARPINGITLNPLEYVLDDDNSVKLYTSDELCELLGYDTIAEAEESGFVIEEE